MMHNNSNSQFLVLNSFVHGVNMNFEVNSGFQHAGSVPNVCATHQLLSV